MNAKDVRTKKVQIHLDKPRTIKFDLNAFCELEEAYGTMDKAMAAMKDGSVKAVRAVLWAGLIHEDPELTIQQVGSLIDFHSLNNVVKQLGIALEDALPEEADNPNGTEDEAVSSGNPRLFQ